MTKRDDAFEIENGIILDDEAVHISSGADAPSHVANYGDIYFRTNGDKYKYLDGWVLQIIEPQPCFTGYNCGEVTTERVYHLEDIAGGAAIITATTVPFDTISSNSDTRAFTASSGEVNVNIADRYWVTFDVSTDIANTSRSDSKGYLELDTGSGFSMVDGTLAFMYNRSSAAGKGTGTATVLLDLNKNDKIRVRAARDTGNGTIVLVAGGSRLSIIPVNSKEDINMFNIDCGDVGTNAVFCKYDCGEI